MYKESVFNVYFTVDGESYVFNSLSGALLQMEEGYPEKATPEEVEVLLNEGIVRESDYDELAEFENAIQGNVRKQVNKAYVTLVLSQACNFNCSYCYQDHQQRILTTADALILADKIEDKIKNGLQEIQVNYFGGEPFTNIPAMLAFNARMEGFSKQYGVRYRALTSTNGEFVTRDVLNQIHFEKVRLTFDGDEYWHNTIRRARRFTYSKQLDLMEEFLDRGTVVEARFNVCKENAHAFLCTLKDITNLPQFENNAVRLVVAPMKNARYDRSITELSSKEFADEYREILACARSQGMKIDLPQAATSPCPFDYGLAYCIGPRLERMYCSECFDRPNDNEFSMKHEYKIPEQCRSCAVLPLCLGPCSRRTLEESCIPERLVLKEILTDYVRAYLTESQQADPIAI